MQNIQSFLWDFDGTLFDTYPIIIDCLRQALREYGHDCDPVDAMQRMLDTIPAARDHYADTFGIPREDLMEAHDRHHRQAIERLAAEPMAGVREVLARIRESGRKNYIFTHSSEEKIHRYLQKFGLEDYIQDVVGTSCPRFVRKPAPDTLLYLMEKNGIDPASAVMVGDRDCDLECGRRAGTKTAHFVCAVAPEELPCDWRFTDFTQMLELL